MLNLQAIGVLGQRLSKSVERKTLPCTILCRHYQRLEEKVSTREGGEKDVIKVVWKQPQWRWRTSNVTFLILAGGVCSTGISNDWTNQVNWTSKKRDASFQKVGKYEKSLLEFGHLHALRYFYIRKHKINIDFLTLMCNLTMGKAKYEKPCSTRCRRVSTS